MAHEDAGHYGKKHPDGTEPHPGAAEEVRKQSQEEKLSCSAAHGIAKKYGLPPKEIGKTMDLLEIRLTHCQCGMFGYPEPLKKRIEALDEDELPPGLESALEGAVENEVISCAAVWQIAKTLKIPKLTAACGCETLGYRIKPCQLGSF